MKGPDHAWFRESELPLVVMRFPAQATDDVRACQEATLAWYQTLDRPVVWAIDVSHLIGAPARQRKLHGSYEEKMRPYQARHGGLLVGASAVCLGDRTHARRGEGLGASPQRIPRAWRTFTESWMRASCRSCA